jgi:hypothetical protein
MCTTNHTRYNLYRYSQSMKKASKRFRDKPVTALETGKFWVEYVLTNNASVVQPPNLLLNFIDLQNLDVYIVIFLIFMLLLMIPGYFIKKIVISCSKRLKSQPAKLKEN